MQTAMPVGFWLGILSAALCVGYLLARHVAARRSYPALAKAEIVYQEWFASGASQKNALTQIGGARNCLRLVVTDDLLWITSWFPFVLFAAAYDLEHIVPRERIASVELGRSFGIERLRLTYTDASGASHGVDLIPRDRARFLAALGRQPDGARKAA